MGKDKLQRNGAFNETGKLLHIHSLLPHHVAMAYIIHQPALETAKKGFRWWHLYHWKSQLLLKKKLKTTTAVRA